MLLLLMFVADLLAVFQTFCFSLILDSFWLLFTLTFFCCSFTAIVKNRPARRLTLRANFGVVLTSFLLVLFFLGLRFRWCEINSSSQVFPYLDDALIYAFGLFPERPAPQIGSIDIEGNFNNMLLTLSFPPLVAVGVLGYLIGPHVARLLDKRFMGKEK